MESKKTCEFDSELNVVLAYIYMHKRRTSHPATGNYFSVMIEPRTCGIRRNCQYNYALPSVARRATFGLLIQ
jgi:hypothetical protein